MANNSDSLADDYKCESCIHGQGKYYAPKECKTCNGTSAYKPVPEDAVSK